jgi:hypothetical protein
MLEALRVYKKLTVNGGVRLGDRFYIPLDRLEAGIEIDLNDQKEVAQEIKNLQRRKVLTSRDRKRLKELKKERETLKTYIAKTKKEILLRQQIEALWNGN